LFAVLGTQILATFIAVYGFLMPPLGWGWAGFVWAYALVWFLVTDPVKLLAYRIFDPVKAVAKPEARGPKMEAKVETQIAVHAQTPV
jgi:H+-transporting ATPase